jgi:hypothetical protein
MHSNTAKSTQSNNSSAKKASIMSSSIKGKAALALALTSLVVVLSQFGTNDAANKTVTTVASSIRRKLQDTSKVISISLIGERHSGTNWITDHLNECFADDLIVRTHAAAFEWRFCNNV